MLIEYGTIVLGEEDCAWKSMKRCPSSNQGFRATSSQPHNITGMFTRRFVRRTKCCEGFPRIGTVDWDSRMLI